MSVIKNGCEEIVKQARCFMLRDALFSTTFKPMTLIVFCCDRVAKSGTPKNYAHDVKLKPSHRALKCTGGRRPPHERQEHHRQHPRDAHKRSRNMASARAAVQLSTKAHLRPHADFLELIPHWNCTRLATCNCNDAVSLAHRPRLSPPTVSS